MKKIVRGNDFTLRIPVMKIVNGERVAFPLPGCTDIKVNVVNQYRRVALGYTIDVSADNVLLARVEGDKVAVGTYALEVKGKLFGNDWRSNEYEQFQIVDNNASGDTAFEPQEGEDSVEMDTALVVLAPSVELGNLIKDAEETIAGTKEALKGVETKMGDIEQRADTAIGAATTAAERANTAAEKTEQTNAVVETAERERVAAEQERKAAEEQRKSQMQSNAEAEQARADAEQHRVEAEKRRASAETMRAAAEETRKTDEADRITGETSREKQENSRVAAEQTRDEQETRRKIDETRRADAEVKRAVAENTRKRMEADRANAETARADAETKRAAAETKRAAAETKREMDFSVKVAEVDTAVKNAKTATSEAEKVDATITDANVFEVTGRDGVKKSLALVEKAEAATIKTELAEKFDKANVVQELGDAENKVVSQKAISHTLKEVNSKLQEVKLDTEKNRNSLYGHNYQQSLGTMFADRAYNNVIFTANPIEFDNAIVKKVKFFTSDNTITICVCTIGEDRKIHIKDSYTTKTVRDASVEVDCWLKADKGDFIALSRVAYTSISGIKTKVSIASSLIEGSVLERDEEINIQFAYDFEVQSSVKEIGICEINDILKFDVTKSTDSYTIDSSLNVSTDNGKLHIKNNSIPSNRVHVKFCKRFLVKGHYYFAYCKLKNNLQTKKMNGFGLMIGGLTPTANTYRIPVDDVDKEFEMYGSQLFNGESGMYDATFFVYPIEGMSEGTFIDLYIEKVQILDLGEDRPRISEYYKNLVRLGDYKPKFTYSTVSASSINHSLYKGLKLKSLGDSLPETRSYQYIVANELGAEYDGDPDNFNYVENGISKIGISHVKGGTWCAPVTTKQGDSIGAGGENTQSISMSAYMRARTLKYLMPDILIIECGTNDAVDAENFEIYKGKNPQGEIVHDHGINDPAYTGDGVDCSDGVYQDDKGYNKAPSLGASYRGMLKQIFSDMPNIKVICLGCPYDRLSMETSTSKVDLYYKDTRLKNAVIKKVASEFGCIYIDVAEEGYGPNAYNINLLTIDGLHFSSQGGRRIAELILAKL